MAITRRESAFTLISDLMGVLNLDIPAVIVGNDDATVSNFLRLANGAGRELMMDPYKWQDIQAEMTITTVPGVSVYDLPSDFDGFFADASWNRTTRLPVLGSLSQYEWQMLKARLIAGSTFTVLFRVINGQVEFYDTPTAAQTIVLPYNSRGWLKDAASTTRYDTINADTDIVLFDPQMFKAKLRVLWYEVKGFDTTKVEKAFMRLKATAQANDIPGRTLSLSPGSDYPYLGQINVPDTGYGS